LVRAVGVALALVAATAAGLVVLIALAPSWDGFQPASCLPHCFCEAVRAGAIKQPANTWSNLGFVFVGGLVVGAGRDRAFGWAIVFLGPASMALHATLTLGGQWIDVVSMYLVPTLLVARNVRAPLWAYVVVNGALGGVMWVWPGTRRWLFVGLLVVLVASELKVPRPRRLLALAAAAFASAATAWALDMTGTVCAPESWLQGHALWHLGCAAAVGLLYAHSVTEPR
jgi:hypothetical protein